MQKSSAAEAKEAPQKMKANKCATYFHLWIHKICLITHYKNVACNFFLVDLPSVACHMKSNVWYNMSAPAQSKKQTLQSLQQRGLRAFLYAPIELYIFTNFTPVFIHRHRKIIIVSVGSQKNKVSSIKKGMAQKTKQERKSLPKRQVHFCTFCIADMFCWRCNE